MLSRDEFHIAVIADKSACRRSVLDTIHARIERDCEILPVPIEWLGWSCAKHGYTHERENSAI